MIHIWNETKDYEYHGFCEAAMLNESFALAYCGDWVIHAVGNEVNEVCDEADCEACILMYFAEKAEETNGLSS